MIQKRNGVGRAVGAAGFWVFVLIAVLPIAAGLVYALLYSFGLTGLLNEGFTLSHWRAVTGSLTFWSSLFWSLYIAGSTVVATVAMALALALWLVPQLEGRPVPLAYYVPLTLPATVSAFLVFHLFSATGPIAGALAQLGAFSADAPVFSPVHDEAGIGILLALLVVTIPFFLILFLQIYRNERLDEISRLASSLGAGRYARTTRVTIPVLLFRARTNIILLFVAVLGAYEIPLLVGRQSPEMLSVLTLRKLAHYDLTARSEAFIAALLYAGLVFALLFPLLNKQGEADG